MGFPTLPDQVTPSSASLTGSQIKSFRFQLEKPIAVFNA